MRSEAVETEWEMPMVDDALARAAGGCQEAFADLVREHQSMVFSLALHFLHDRDAAQELAQQVFLTLYRNLHSIRSADHLRFWLRKVAARRCIDYARRQRRRRWLGMEAAPELATAPQDADPVLGRTLRRLVASLPEKRRVVVILRYQEDLDPLEIAAVLGISLNTVKSRLQRALALLRTKLASATQQACL
jgi:RNA polymerase sigma-70 factor (ECF subfamily)